MTTIRLGTAIATDSQGLTTTFGQLNFTCQ